MEDVKFATVEGACDLHCHCGKPSCDTRPFSDIFVAQQAAAAGMAALVFKSHYENTVARAYYVNQAVPEIRLFGGIALNRYVGGLNPSAVEAALVAGGREVWLPGIDSARHIEVFGKAGSYEVHGKITGPRQLLSKPLQTNFSGYRVVEGGKLKQEVIDIVRLVAGHDAFFTSGHLAKEEILELAILAKKEGAKMLVDHPLFEAPGFSYSEIDQLREIADLGAYIGIFAAMAFPADLATNLDGDKKLIETIGADRCILASDAGSAVYPIPNEALRTYAQNLFDKGVSLDDLNTMMVKNPRKLLSI